MSGPPPGYNPGDSLLQGGSTTITPMQGGGGTHGDPELSLLQGGNTAVITPLKGGRRSLKNKSKKNTRSKSRRRLAMIVQETTITYPTVATVVFSLHPKVAKALKIKQKKGGDKKKKSS
jgi:hypothetical protein